MRIEIVEDKSGLEALRGAAVVLDILRACHTALALLAAGAGEVRLVAGLEAARGLKAAHPAWPLLGERGGIPPQDFDGDNSPSRAAGLRMEGSPVILTTSAGTQAVHRLNNAGAVFMGTLAGASALVRALEELRPEAVHLIPMGWMAREPALEDDLAARYLRDRLLGRSPDFGPLRRAILESPAAERLRSRGLEADLRFCTALDSHDLVPRVLYDTDPPRAVTLLLPCQIM